MLINGCLPDTDATFILVQDENVNTAFTSEALKGWPFNASR